MYSLAKKTISCILILFILAINPIFAEGIKGHIEKDEQNKQELDKKMFTGEIETLESRKDVINLTVSQVLSSGYTLEGDEFFAEVSQDVETDKGVIIPIGTIVHGNVKMIQDPKNFSRDGYVSVDFDYMVTPDGRQIPIQASFSTKDAPIKGAAKTVGIHAGYTLLGGVAGGLFALNSLGLGAAIASQGYTLAAGAAVGGAVGLTMAIIKKGKSFMLKPGDQLKIKVQEDIQMPVFTKEAFLQEEQLLEGLNVKINSVAYEKDPFGVDNTITLQLAIDNYSKYTFSTFDIALVSNTSDKFYASPFGDSSLWFKTIAPGDRLAGKLSFSVNDKKSRHWLVFYDRRTKKPLAKYSVDNARTLLKAQKKKKKKTKNS